MFDYSPILQRLISEENLFPDLSQDSIPWDPDIPIPGFGPCKKKTPAKKRGPFNIKQLKHIETMLAQAFPMSFIAHLYAMNNFHVFQLEPNGVNPIRPEGVRGATNDLNTVKHQWDEVPDANIAISLGPSGITVLEAQYSLENDITTAVQKFLRDANRQSTYCGFITKTHNNAVNYYYRDRNIKGIQYINENLSIRGAGTYVVAAGSMVNGKRYMLERSEFLTKMPREFKLLAKVCDSLPINTLKSASNLYESHRNEDIHDFIGELVRNGKNVKEIHETLKKINGNFYNWPLNELDLYNEVNSILLHMHVRSGQIS